MDVSSVSSDSAGEMSMREFYETFKGHVDREEIEFVGKMLHDYERTILKSKDLSVLDSELREDLTSVVQRALQCMKRYKATLKKGEYCLVVHPETDRWVTGRVLENSGGSITFRFDDTRESKRVSLNASSIAPLKSFEAPKEKKPRQQKKKLPFSEGDVVAAVDIDAETDAVKQHEVFDPAAIVEKFYAGLYSAKESKNIPLIGQQLEDLNKQLIDENFQVYTQTPEYAKLETLVDEAQIVVDDWKSNLKFGDECDVYQQKYRAWYCAKVISTPKDGYFRVHYQGWQPRFDENVFVADTMIYPPNTFTKPWKKGKGSKRKVENTAEIVEIQPAAPSTDGKRWVTGLGYVDNVPADTGLKSRTGRTIISKTTEPPVKKMRQRAKKSMEGGDKADHNDFICATCNLFEASDHSDLILCDGPCLQSWHLGCMGVGKDKIPDGEWYCEDCSSSRHKCDVCGNYGADFFEVMKCSDRNCGKYFHYNCLIDKCEHYIIEKEPSESFIDPFDSTEEESAQTSDNYRKEFKTLTDISEIKAQLIEAKEGSRQHEKLLGELERAESAQRKHQEYLENISFKFKCPYHFCHTCYPIYKKVRPGPLYKCISCPTAYHTNCIVPGSRYNIACLICDKHPNGTLPACETVAEDLVPSNHLFWDQMYIPELDPDVSDLASHHFMLPLKLKLDVGSQAPNFKSIFRLCYDSYPGGEKAIPLQLPEECCSCKVRCDEACLNRISKIECYDITGNKREAICNNSQTCDGDCGNRQFQKRDYVKVQPFQEGEMGWGLKSVDFVQKGTLVIEYLGEVINEEEMQRRMRYQRTYQPRDHDFYIMELQHGIFVDGKHKGNHSRFINHSCDPNCELVRWNVRGRIHIGIFAVKEIMSGEPLSYDYQFDTKESEAFMCHCGTSKCRGTMAPKTKGPQDKSSLTREERNKLIAAAKQREKRLTEQKLAEEMKRNCVGKTVPGDRGFLVKDGPLKICFNKARSGRIFLPRNARRGYNFIQRREVMWKRAAVASVTAAENSFTIEESSCS